MTTPRIVGAVLAAVVAIAVGVALLVLDGTDARQGRPPSGHGTDTSPIWGMAGPYRARSIAAFRRRGGRITLVEIDWSRAEPREGVFDGDYLRGVEDEIAEHRANGFQIVLNYGLHDAPGWLLRKPNARLVNQAGAPYTERPLPNLIFARELRRYAERYTAALFRRIGTNFFAVRVGGGPRGELSYPSVADDARGKIRNYYYAFDGAARRTNPVPGWKPCLPSPNNEARLFLSWYLTRLTEFQNWQIQVLRRYYPGYIAVLYPSWGMRKGDFEAAIATNLCGASSAEVNGEVQRGFDHAGHIGAIRDPKAAVWGTWADRHETIDWLSSLADRHDPPLKKFAENSGFDSESKMRIAVEAAKRNGLTAFMWMRMSDATCGCGRYATLDDYARLVSTISR
jgi:Beta-galactosidase